MRRESVWLAWAGIVCVSVGFVALVAAPFGAWATSGNLSSIDLVRAVGLAGSDAVAAPASVGRIEVIVFALFLTGVATAGVGGRVAAALRLSIGVAALMAVGRLASSRLVGTGAGTGLVLAVVGGMLVVVGSVLGLLTTGAMSRSARWIPFGVGVAATGVLLVGLAGSPDLGAADEEAARDGLTMSLQSGDLYGAATFLHPDDLVEEGAVALGVDALLGYVGLEPLSPDARPGSLVSSAIGFAVRLLPTDEVDGRTYVRIVGATD